MAKKNTTAPEDEIKAEQEEQTPVTEEPIPGVEAPAAPSEVELAQAAQAAEHERYLLLAAEYDNFRKRTQKEKTEIYHTAFADAAKKFLPVYDNLLRALQNETADEAYKKGVEMTLSQMYQVMEKMGIVEIPALGEQFDPELHNAVLHIEDESIDDNTIVEVFEKGFKMGDRVLRHSIVKVAN